ncbi:hypothetical protein [Rhodococcus sp. 14-2483-1-2]|uniref:hypothetical protein n=1 Tax=Rhodococcus sp. 14-2483-1-2 TaxID=2023147 RepID=UPI00114005F7|nr:hypothetical protein [Rhodococcus sp. 14-2483-1-2]
MNVTGDEDALEPSRALWLRHVFDQREDDGVAAISTAAPPEIQFATTSDVAALWPGAGDHRAPILNHTLATRKERCQDVDQIQ